MNLRKLSPELAVIVLLFLCIPHLFATPASEGRKWVVQNPNSIEFTALGIHFLSHDAKTGPSSTTTVLQLADGKPWVVAFEIQLGPSLSSSMSIHLKKGKTDVAWLGADDYYKYLSAFIGSGNSNMPLTQMWDTNWHRFEYRSDGKIITLWHDGSKCGEGIQISTPDTLEFGSAQLEMHVRKVSVECLPILLNQDPNIPFFSEAFISPKYSDRWNISNNGGYSTLADVGLKLVGNGKGYPVLSSVSSPFPPSGDWTASFGYRYTSIGHCGTSLACRGKNAEVVARIMQDSNGQLIQVNETLSWMKPDTAWHVVSFVLSKSHMIAYLDGVLAGERIITVRPTAIVFGGGTPTSPSEWNDMQVAFIRVYTGKKVLDRTALNLNNTPVNRETGVFVAVPHTPMTLAVRERDKSLFCVMGDTVHLAGTVSGQHRLIKRSLEINNSPFTMHSASLDDDGYNFDWKPTAVGKYELTVKYDLQKPYDVLIVKNLSVTVIPKPSLALEQFSKPIASSVPVTVQILDDTSFHPVRVEFFLNAQPIGNVSQTPFKTILPISKQLPGIYSVSYEAYDAQGGHLCGQNEAITVPERVKVTIQPTLILMKEKETLPLIAEIVPDLNVKKVTYFVGDREVGSSEVSPYRLDADLFPFKSATYPIRADVLTNEGATFSSLAVLVNYTNQPDDAQIVQMAKEEADNKVRLLKGEEEKQAELAKHIADDISAKAEAEKAAKRQEENYERDVANNTIKAVEQHQVSIVLDGNISKFDDSYLFSLKITNHSVKVVGPIWPEIRFDDFSIGIPLAYDAELPQPFDENGFPKKYLPDSYHDLVVPSGSTKTISFFVSNTLVSEQKRKPARITFTGTLRAFSIALSP